MESLKSPDCAWIWAGIVFLPSLIVFFCVPSKNIEAESLQSIKRFGEELESVVQPTFSFIFVFQKCFVERWFFAQLFSTSLVIFSHPLCFYIFVSVLFEEFDFGKRELKRRELAKRVGAKFTFERPTDLILWGGLSPRRMPEHVVHTNDPIVQLT